MRTGKSSHLCSLPEVIQFEFRQMQQMHTKLVITNLVDSLISYKIKTTKPGLYLVKPMEGQIYNNSSLQIQFRRKQLSLQNFEAIVLNPNKNKEKFLIEMSCERQDSVGIMQKQEQIAYLGVQFIKATGPVNPTNSQININSDRIKIEENLQARQVFSPKKQTEVNLDEIIIRKKKQLQSAIISKQSLQAQKQHPQRSNLTLNDLINILIVAFLLGFIL